MGSAEDAAAEAAWRLGGAYALWRFVVQAGTVACPEDPFPGWAEPGDCLLCQGAGTVDAALAGAMLRWKPVSVARGALEGTPFITTRKADMEAALREVEMERRMRLLEAGRAAIQLDGEMGFLALAKEHEDGLPCAMCEVQKTHRVCPVCCGRGHVSSAQAGNRLLLWKLSKEYG